jgi:hypothetical protein
VTFRAALQNARRAPVPLHFAPPRGAKLPQVVDQLLRRYGAGDAPRKSAAELDALLRRLQKADCKWESVSPRDRLNVAWVLWRGSEPPAEKRSFLSAFLDWVETPWRRVQARHLASAWAAAFDPSLASIRLVGEWLSARASRLSDPWSRLAREFDVFSTEHGPMRLAKEFLASTENEKGFLDRLRLSGPAAAGGLMLETLGVAASLVEASLERAPRLAARLIDLCFHEGAFRPAAMAKTAPRRAGSVRLKICEALLLPWQHVEPPEEARGQILDHLLANYGDARVNDAVWGDLRPPARKIMRAWLNRRTIETFFRMVGETAPANRGRFRASQRFWTAYRDHIDDAWLLAGPLHFASLKTKATIGRGRLAGCRSGDSALLLRIRGITIAETSNFDSCQAWLAHSDFAPPLYCDRTKPYWLAALTNGADFSPIYARNGNGSWQDGMHDFIECQTGIFVPRHEYLLPDHPG